MLFRLINIAGILTGISLLVTFAAGVFHIFPFHIVSAYITLSLGLTHFGLITYKNWKIRRPK